MPCCVPCVLLGKWNLGHMWTWRDKHMSIQRVAKHGMHLCILDGCSYPLKENKALSQLGALTWWGLPFTCMLVDKFNSVKSSWLISSKLQKRFIQLPNPNMSLLLTQRVLNETCVKKTSCKINNRLINHLSKIVGLNGTCIIHFWH